MSFLASVTGYVVTALLSALAGWLLKVLHLYVQDKQDATDAQQSTAPLKAADPKDGKAIDEAAKSALSGL